MQTPFDDVVSDIKRRGYHNHRLPEHSDTVSRGIYRDLLQLCPAIAGDVNSGVISHWLNVRAPGARGRRIDLFVGEPDDVGRPVLDRLRICVENKSVVTAHRNRDARFDDLNETMNVVHAARPEAVIVATVMVGVAQRVLNVPDAVKRLYRDRMDEFERGLVPRLSIGDQRLWDELSGAVSNNRPSDPELTIKKLSMLPRRKAGFTHDRAYDYILFVPVEVDNVNPPSIARQNSFGLDVDADYRDMLQSICRAYNARWHP